MKTFNFFTLFSENKLPKSWFTNDVTGRLKMVTVFFIYSFVPRVRKTAGARSCCIPELLVLERVLHD